MHRMVETGAIIFKCIALLTLHLVIKHSYKNSPYLAPDPLFTRIYDLRNPCMTWNPMSGMHNPS